MSGKNNKLGRPPGPIRLEKRFVYLSPSDWEKIDKLAKGNGIGGTIQARMILHRALEQMENA